MSAAPIQIDVRATDIVKTLCLGKDGLGLNLVDNQGPSYDLTDGYHNFRVFQHNGPCRPISFRCLRRSGRSKTAREKRPDKQKAAIDWAVNAE